jgi:HSP20 family protein
MNQITRHTPRWLQSDVFGSSDPRFMWPVSRLHQEMNRLFSDAFRGFDDDDADRSGGVTFNPVVDVELEEGQYEITVELPGVAMNDISVEMKDEMLVISGSKERKRTSGSADQQRSERMYGSFQRSFRLPEDAIEEGINARFADGVLTVSIPRDVKRSRAASRRIEVREASRGETIQHASGHGETGRQASEGGEQAGRRASEERPAARPE